MTNHLQELQDRRVKLEQRLTRIVEGHRQPLSKDSEERAQEEENEEVLDSLGNCSLDELLRVRKAIQRYQNGEYGICTQCKNPISAERLQAMPETEFCIECAKSLGD